MKEADYVTLHVPQTEMTREMIGEKEINLMKRGSYLLNASRGNVVCIDELIDSIFYEYLVNTYVSVFHIR